MPINPYINFDGDTREAVEFYAKVFETETPRLMTFEEMPGDPSQPIPEAAKRRIMHALIVVDGTPLMFSDTFPGMPLKAGNNVSLMLGTTDRSKLERWYHALQDGGQVTMPLQETFWSKAYGQVRDRFGIDWQLSLDSGETF
jgi:PhnB protein